MKSKRAHRRRCQPGGWMVLAIFLLSVHAAQAFGQTARTDPLANDLARAESYYNQRKYEDAIIILEKLQQRAPDDPNVIALLRRAYPRTKQYAKLLELLLPRLDQSPSYMQDAATIADCYFRLEMVEKAESTLTALLVPPPSDPLVYREVARIYLQNGRHTQAVATYKQAREHFGKPTLFSRELADIYESRREYSEAIQEYFVDLQENPRNLEIVRRKIAAIVRTEEGTSELKAALQEIATKNPENFLARRLYAELLLQSGDPEAAWPEYLAADELSENPTEHILYYIQYCLENGHFTSARRACETFFERYPDHISFIDVRLAYARALVGLSKPDSAIAVMQEVAGLFTQPERRAEVYYAIGNVYFDDRNGLDSAEYYYRQASSMSRRKDIALGAAIGLGDCRLRRGDVHGADSAYAAVNDLRLTIDEREAVAFKRAKLLFFTAQFDPAGSALKSLIAEYPRGYYVNDAILLNLQITENRDPMDWSLRRFAAASLKKWQLQDDSARVLFRELASDSANTLADDALMELGELYARAGQPDSAVAAYSMVVERYPGGFLVPAALIQQGEVFAGQLNQPDSARAAFHKVLTEFADSPFLEEARRLLKHLGLAQSGGQSTDGSP